MLKKLFNLRNLLAGAISVLILVAAFGFGSTVNQASAGSLAVCRSYSAEKPARAGYFIWSTPYKWVSSCSRFEDIYVSNVYSTVGSCGKFKIVMYPLSGGMQEGNVTTVCGSTKTGIASYVKRGTKYKVISLSPGVKRFKVSEQWEY
jgi:hypothetical protein